MKTITLFERGDKVKFVSFNPVEESKKLYREAEKEEGSGIEHMQHKDNVLKWAKIYGEIDPKGVYPIARDQDCDDLVVVVIANGNEVSVPAIGIRLVK